MRRASMPRRASVEDEAAASAQRPLPGSRASLDDTAWYCVGVVNVGDEGIEYHGPTSAQQPSKLKQRSTLCLQSVRALRLRDEGFWAFLYSRLGHSSEKDDKQAASFYETMLPWLAEEPLVSAVSRTADDPACPWRTPQYGESSAYRSLLEAARYMLLRGSADGAPLRADQAKLATLALRLALIQLARLDLDHVQYLSSNDRSILSLASQQLALAAVKAFDQKWLPAELLRDVHEHIDELRAAMSAKPIKQNEESLPGLLELNRLDTASATSVLHPYFDRATFADVRGLEGVLSPMPKQMPVDFLTLEDMSP